MSVMGKPAGVTRQCVFCGKHFAAHLNQCPFCREMVPQVRLSSTSGSDGGRQIRRGLLYMLLAAVIHYFAAGYAAPLQLPLPIMPILTQYLSPLLFLGGLGLTFYGLILRAKS